VEIEPAQAIPLCADAHRRLLSTIATITDDDVRKPSLMPGWTVGHVVTHLSRNADGHVRRLAGALEGQEVPRYGGGMEQRDRDIETGASRPAAVLLRELQESIAQLEEVWQRSAAAGWPHAELLAGDNFPTTASPLRRLREVEVHHVDLGMGYGPDDWPDTYVEWELPRVLERLPQRFHNPGDAKLLLAWFIGRRSAPDRIELKPWM
jgi:maleylpyruvate isomerase